MEKKYQVGRYSFNNYVNLYVAKAALFFSKKNQFKINYLFIYFHPNSMYKK